MRNGPLDPATIAAGFRRFCLALLRFLGRHVRGPGVWAAPPRRSEPIAADRVSRRDDGDRRTPDQPLDERSAARGGADGYVAAARFTADILRIREDVSPVLRALSLAGRPGALVGRATHRAAGVIDRLFGTRPGATVTQERRRARRENARAQDVREIVATAAGPRSVAPQEPVPAAIETGGSLAGQRAELIVTVTGPGGARVTVSGSGSPRIEVEVSPTRDPRAERTVHVQVSGAPYEASRPSRRRGLRANHLVWFACSTLALAVLVVGFLCARWLDVGFLGDTSSIFSLVVAVVTFMVQTWPRRADAGGRG